MEVDKTDKLSDSVLYACSELVGVCKGMFGILSEGLINID